jgi:hypothetical protein
MLGVGDVSNNGYNWGPTLIHKQTFGVELDPNSNSKSHHQTMEIYWVISQMCFLKQGKRIRI